MTIKPLSYSEVDLFYSDREAWRRRYIEGQFDEPTDAQLFGSFIHTLLEHTNNPKKKPITYQVAMRLTRAHLLQQGRIGAAKYFGRRYEPVVRQILNECTPLLLPEREVSIIVELPKLEAKLHVKLDGLDVAKRQLADYKTFTSNNKFNVWTQRRVDTNMQFSVYALAFRLIWHTHLTDIFVDTIDVKLKRGHKKIRVKRLSTNRDYHSCIKAYDWLAAAATEMRLLGLWEKRIPASKRVSDKQLLLFNITGGKM